jgi:hypothetical protein
MKLYLMKRAIFISCIISFGKHKTNLLFEGGFQVICCGKNGQFLFGDIFRFLQIFIEIDY